ncbi:MAG: DNA polymerase I [Candidatus Puniceispirillales bacterium]
MNLKPEKNTEEKLILVDGSGYIFRAYYALPPMSNSKGVPINAVYGFTNMMIKLIEDFNPKNICVLFDFGRETFRNKIYSEYKANRTSPPEDLIPQFDLIKEASRSIGLPTIEMEGFEADDLIATFVNKAKSEKKEIIVVSSDKDLMQLVKPNVLMLDPMKNSWIDEDKVREKFGVQPHKVIDVQALAGDSSDNIPGVPGIGLKTAADLINEFGNLEDLLSRSHEIKQNKRRENLIEFKNLALVSKELVTLKNDVPIDITLDELKFDFSRNRDIFIEFLKKHSFKRILEKVNNETVLDNISSVKKPNEKNNFNERQVNYRLITSESELVEIIEICNEKIVIAFDCETNSLNSKSTDLVGLSIAYDIGQAVYIPLRHIKDDSDLFENKKTQDFTNQIEFRKAINLIKPILEDPSILKVGHNIKFDMNVLRQYHNGNVHIYPVDDTMCMSYALNLGKVQNHKLDTLALVELNHSTIKYEDICGKGVNQKTFDLINPLEALEYAAEDSDVVLALYEVYKERLFFEKKSFVYQKLERELIPVLSDIENEGIIVNQQTLNSLSEALSKNILELEKKIFSISNQEFNIGSPKQLGEILFDKLKLEKGKKSKSGAWQTSVSILEDLSEKNHEIANFLLDWRHFSKLKSTYSKALIEQINTKTQRIHTSYSMVGTSTGRLSSSDPNLQNIPIKTNEGKLIRTAFESKSNYLLLSMDYSQIELRLIAHIAEEKGMLSAFNENIDIHLDTASKIFNKSKDEVTSDLRRSAKAINFGIIYGISPFGLAKQLKCSNSEAKEFIDSYFNRFPNIKNYMEDIKRKLYSDGFVETLFGRRMYINIQKNSNQNLRLFSERQAINAPIQGTAADIIKLAMVKVNNNLKHNNFDAKILLQVHDELVFEVKDTDIDNIINSIKPIMENAHLPIKPLNVKLSVDYGFAKNWADAH